MTSIMYVCDPCRDGAPESCGHDDRDDLRVLPDTAEYTETTICHACWEAWADWAGDRGERPDWNSLPMPPAMIDMPTKAEKGPVQILCEEIGWQWAQPFDDRLERINVLIAFVLVLIDEIDDLRDTHAAIAKLVNVTAPGSEYDGIRFQLVSALNLTPEDGLIAEAERLHELTWQDEEGESFDPYIELLSSCISAIRFGLEKPCHSRHAAEAACQIWRKRYSGTSDRYTGAWVKDWARHKFQEALLRLLATA